MEQNHIGTVGVPAQKSAIPSRSDDFSFIADGRDKWGLAFLITTDSVPGKRAGGSLSWAASTIPTTGWTRPGHHRHDHDAVLPFADRKALALYDSFERGVYQLAAKG